MADNEITFTFTANSTQLTQAADQAANSLEKVNAASNEQGDTKSEDTLITDIERLSEVCKKGAVSIANLPLAKLGKQLGELSDMDSEIGGLSDALTKFSSTLDSVITHSTETVESYGDLRAELNALATDLRQGSISTQEAAAAFKELGQSITSQNQLAKELRQNVQKLSSEQASLINAKQQEVAAYRQTQAAAREELNAFTAAQEKKLAARRIEAASIEELEQKLAELDAAAQEARRKGDAVSELESAKAMEQTIDVLQRKEEATKKAAEAMEKAAKAAQEQAAKMELATKSSGELKDEATQLAECLKETAKSGNTEAYVKLVKQLKVVKQAIRETTAAEKNQQSALLGKARAGFYAAQQLGGLAKEVREGNINLANMTGTVMAVSMAIKAGLGPLGWAAMAVQGLQMAWDYFSSSQKAAKEATEQATKAIAEQNAELGRQAIAIQDAKYDELTANLERETDALEEATQRELRTHDTAAKADADRTASAIRQAQARINARKQEMQAMVDTGELSASAMKEETARLDAELAAMQQAAADKAEEAARKRLDIEQEGLVRQRRLLQSAMHDFESENSEAFTRFWTDEVDKQANNLNAQIEAFAAELKGLEADQKALVEQLVAAKKNDDDQLAEAIRLSLKNTEDKISATSRQLDNATKEFQDVIGDLIDDKEHHIFELGGKEFVAAALDLRAKGKELEAKTREIQQKIWENGDNVEDAQRAAQLRKEELAAQEEALGLVEESNRKKEETLEAQKQLADGLDGIVNQYRTHRQYAESAGLTQQQMLEADKATLETKLENLRELRKQGGHGGVSLEPLDKAIAETESQLRGLAQAMDKEAASAAMKAVEGTLRGLERQYKTSTDYARQSGRTQAQIHREDLRILQEKEKRLQELRAAPGIDAKTEGDINRALQSTREQISGLKAAMAASAANARRWIRETEPPKLQAKNKVVQGALDRLAKTYRLTAARAARAAEKGDWKAYERSMRTMGNAEKNMNKLAKNSGQVAGYTGAMKTNVKAIADAARSGAASEKEAARAAKRKAGAQKKAAAAIEQQRPKEKVEDAAQKIAALSAQMNSAQKQMERLGQQVAGLRDSIGALAAAACGAADAAGNAASAANSAVKSVEKRIRACEKSIDKLRR